MTAAINASSGVISVSALSSEFASATFYALVDSTTIYTQILTLNRSKDGASAPIINLTALKQAAFIKSPATSTDQGTWSPSTITLNADTFNIPTSTTYYWSVAVNDGSFTDLTSGVDLKQYSVSQFTSGTKTYKIQATANGQTINDTQTIYTLESGGNGITVGLANPSQQISCSALGVPSSGINITTEFLALRGTDFINPAYFTFSQTAQTGLTNSTSTINSNGIITVPSSYIDSSIGVRQATITYRMLGTAGTPSAGIDVSKVLTINKTLDGAKGDSGINTATVALYAVFSSSTSYPTLPSGTFVYTFSSSTLTPKTGTSSTLGSWSQSVPTVGLNQYLWGIYAVAASNTTSDEVLSSEFSTPVVSSSGGTAGINTAVVTLYNKNTSSTSAPSPFSGTFSYQFSSGILSLLSNASFNNWSQTPPNLDKGDYLWVRYAIASSSNIGDEILASEFSAAVVSGIAGIDGTNGKSSYTATVYTQSASIPTVAPTGGSYNFSNSTLSVPSSSGFSWSPTLPTSSTTLTTYSSSYTFISTTTITDTINATTWSQPVAILKNGTNGVNADTLSFEYSSDNVYFHPNWVSGDVYVHVKKVSGVDSSVTYGPSQKYIPTLGVEYTVTNGKTAYLHIKYSDNGGTSFTDNGGESAGSWIGTYSDNTEQDSTLLSAYTWTKLTGNQGNPGNPGPRNASGYLYYYIAQSTQPTAYVPGTNGLGLYNFSTNTFASLGLWSFTAPSPSASTSYTGTDNKVWAIRYSVSETTYNLDSTQTSTFTSAFNVINFEGLVTFTNATTTNSPIKTALDAKLTGTDIYTPNTTKIDGGKITTGSIDASSLKIGTFDGNGNPTNTGERIIISQTKIEVFDASNNRRVVIGNLG